MAWEFNPASGLIIIEVILEKGDRNDRLQLALDTGASHSCISDRSLELIGYEPEKSPSKTTVTTGSGEVYVPVISVEKLKALGKEVTDLSVTAMKLPASATIDGVLGLDFLRGHKLTIDFPKGEIHLE